MGEARFDIAMAIAWTIEVNLEDFVAGARAFELDGELWVFVDDPSISSPEQLKATTRISQAALPDSVTAVHYVLIYWVPTGQEKVALGLGRTAKTVRMALRKILDLPSTFDASQETVITEALAPIRALGTEPVRMTLVDQQANRYHDAALELAERVRSGGGLVFVEAEAGKGKTILLASAAQSLRSDTRGKLPVYIPLRKLPLASGIGWDGITQLIGIVGKGADRLVRAVKSGLVAIFLDGIDEVSGRYDKNLIRDLLNLITQRLGSSESVVVLSGRRTEARHVNNSSWTILSVDLPEISSDDFKSYVGAVLDDLISQSKRLSEIELPAEYNELIGNRPADEQVVRERSDIVTWILDVFPEVAKEPSLFFVQGLAAIAIGRRSGNRAPLRLDGRPFVPIVRDVCLSAAVFACIREASKVDSIATKEYSVKNQMRVLQGLAALSSAPEAASAPTPNELVPKAFDVDPINSPEILVAITRQNAKHALIYATEAAGAYRPQFLSDWVRCALLAQIFMRETSLGYLQANESLTLAVSAERAKYTFESLLPSALGDNAVDEQWCQAFDRAISAGFEAASANFWFLRAAVGDERLSGTMHAPLPLAEITDVEFAGFVIDKELSGSDFILDGNRFVNSSVSNVRLKDVSLRDVSFENCTVSNLELIDCEGPISFEGCDLTHVKIKNTKASKKPALHFNNCMFRGNGNQISQDVPAYGESSYDPPAVFVECVSECAVDGIVSGDWSVKENMLNGISTEIVQETSAAEACLRRALRAFFPSHIGDGSTLQVRRYIRLSALGRGSMPTGAPGQEELQRIFESFGFTTGGRSDHLYAPWSGVVGATQSSMELRAELTDFLLRKTDPGPSVQRMIARLEARFS
nr:NACHT domain-containing protein [uncultured Albidiferax sp.]